MTLIDAVLLGLIQGITEFIPVSSSGHLILLSELTSVKGAFEFDVLLNIGTLCALLIHFRARLKEVASRMISGGDNRLARNVVISTIPAVLVGGLFGNFFAQDAVRSVWVVALMLFIVGVLMVMPWKMTVAPDKPKTLYHVPKPQALYIGLAQVLALIPGTSRSGITILAGRLSRLPFNRAAEYSFLMGIPIFVGAIGSTLIKSEGRAFLVDNFEAVILGNIVAFVSGMIALKFVMRLLANRGVWIFGYYRIALAVVLLLTLL